MAQKLVYWGLNGSGKSTLLKIMAGKDVDYLGETMLSSGYSVGLLEQEPHLDAEKCCAGSGRRSGTAYS